MYLCQKKQYFNGASLLWLGFQSQRKTSFIHNRWLLLDNVFNLWVSKTLVLQHYLDIPLMLQGITKETWNAPYKHQQNYWLWRLKMIMKDYRRCPVNKKIWINHLASRYLVHFQCPDRKCTVVYRQWVLPSGPGSSVLDYRKTGGPLFKAMRDCKDALDAYRLDCHSMRCLM